MIQVVITSIILGITIILVVLRFLKFFRKKKTGASNGPMCTGSCVNCTAECQIRDFSEMKPVGKARQTEKYTSEKSKTISEIKKSGENDSC